MKKLFILPALLLAFNLYAFEVGDKVEILEGEYSGIECSILGVYTTTENETFYGVRCDLATGVIYVGTHKENELQVSAGNR